MTTATALLSGVGVEVTNALECTVSLFDAQEASENIFVSPIIAPAFALDDEEDEDDFDDDDDDPDDFDDDDDDLWDDEEEDESFQDDEGEDDDLLTGDEGEGVGELALDDEKEDDEDKEDDF